MSFLLNTQFSQGQEAGEQNLQVLFILANMCFLLSQDIAILCARSVENDQ